MGCIIKWFAISMVGLFIVGSYVTIKERYFPTPEVKIEETFVQLDEIFQLNNVELTINNVELTEERNEFLKQNRVLKVTYTIKNNTENQIPYVLFFHYRQKIDGACDIIFKVINGLLNGICHRFMTGEMDHSIDFLLSLLPLEYIPQKPPVSYISFIKGDLASCYFFYIVFDGYFGITEVVDHHRIMAGFF